MFLLYLANIHIGHILRPNIILRTKKLHLQNFMFELDIKLCW